jgi:hypothetical protein
MEDATMQILGSCCSIAAIGLTFTQLFFKRLDKLENVFVESIRRINENIVRLDKSLAVVDHCLKKGERDEAGY